MFDDWTNQKNHYDGCELQGMSFRERAAVFFSRIFSTRLMRVVY
jgi:hypothetical protein